MRRRAKRALDRQLAYQRDKVLKLRGHEQSVIDSMIRHSRQVREKLKQVFRGPRLVSTRPEIPH